MKEKNFYISLARVICAFTVVVIHTNICFYDFDLELGCWKWANLIEGSLCYAVPVFLMISGALLMDYSKKYTTAEYLKKRFLRTMVPFIIWTLISKIVGIDAFLVYYFFIYQFGIYLAIPAFTYIKDEYKEKIIKYVIAVSFLINYLIPFLYMISNRFDNYRMPFEIAGGYLIYALLGYIIHKNDIPLKWRLVSYAVSMIGLAFLVGGTYVLSIKNGALNGNFVGYKNLPCLLLSVGVFIFIKQIGQMITSTKIQKFIEWLSSYTFSIFLVHFFVLKLLVEPMFIEYVHTMRYKVASPFLTFAITFVIVWILRKIPLLNKILP